ncbi:MAG TPA: metalloregulator ArsR/SmtB family transcription factor [Chitinophagaceae bacterium]|nr:metalloregulator ArsR/SmtB family transcription factor [Chitinophagaceae bacterium]
MRIRKNANIRKDDRRVATLANSLAHPVRVALVRYLLEKNCGKGVDNVTCNKDLVNIFPYSQSTISQHVKILKEAGVFLTEEREKYTFYEINPALLKKIKAFIG